MIATRPRAGPQGHRRPGAQPHLRRARWFRAALAAGPGSPERARYLFREGRGEDGESRPTTGSRSSAAPAWTRGPGRPVVPPPLRHHPARPRLAQPRGRRSSRTSCASGSTAASTASGSTSRTACSRRRACATRCRGAARTAGSLRLDGRAHGCRRADVGPARGPRRLPALAPRPRRVRRRPDGGRRGLDPDAGVDGPLRPPRRDATRPSTSPGCWPSGRPTAFAEVVDGTLDAMAPVGAAPTWVLSNHDVVRHVDPVRRRRARPGPGPGGDADDAGAARLGVPLPGRGARPGAGRRRTRDRQDPACAAHRRGRPRRLPGADPVGGRRPAVRLRPGRGPAWLPQPADWARAHRRGAGGRRRARRWSSTARRWPRAASTRSTPATRSRCRRRPTTCSSFAAARSPWSSTAATTPVELPAGEVLVASGPVDARAARRHRRLAALTRRRASPVVEGGVVAAELVDEVVELGRRTSRRAARRSRSAVLARPREPARASSRDREQGGAAVVPGRARGHQAEVDEVLDLPADRALVDVDARRPGPRRAAGRPRRGAPAQVRRRLQVRVHGAGPVADDPAYRRIRTPTSCSMPRSVSAPLTAPLALLGRPPRARARRRAGRWSAAAPPG